MQKKLKWCFKIKDGAKLLKPSKIISDSYISLAKNSLKRAEAIFKEGDFLWTTVMIYYAEYYALYSFLARIGIKCENHSCSILITKILIGEEKVRTIEEHKEKRLDAQYYLRVPEESKIRNMLNHAKVFVADFEEIVSKINEEKIISFRSKIRNLLS